MLLSIVSHKKKWILFDFESCGLGKIPLLFSDTAPTDIKFLSEFCLNTEEQAAGLSSLWAANTLPHLKSLLFFLGLRRGIASCKFLYVSSFHTPRSEK